MASVLNSEEGLQTRKNTLVSLQWVLVIVTSYFVLFNKGETVNDPRTFMLIVMSLAFMLVLYRLPLRVYDHKLFAPILVVVDTLLTTVAIGLNRENPWDLFIVFYFGLFIAAIGENLVQILGGCFIITIFSVVLSTYQGGVSAVDPEILIRVPFIFGVTLLYGYLGIQVKNEKKKGGKCGGDAATQAPAGIGIGPRHKESPRRNYVLCRHGSHSPRKRTKRQRKLAGPPCHSRKRRTHR